MKARRSCSIVAGMSKVPAKEDAHVSMHGAALRKGEPRKPCVFAAAARANETFAPAHPFYIADMIAIGGALVSRIQRSWAPPSHGGHVFRAPIGQRGRFRIAATLQR